MVDPIVTPPAPDANAPAPLPTTVALNPPMVGTASPFERVDGQNRDLILEAIRAWARGPLVDWAGGWQNSLIEWLGDTSNWLETWNDETVRYVQDALQSVINNSVDLQDPVVAQLMSNPESLLNGETVEVVQAVLGGGVEGLTRTVNAVGAPATPRPAWAGVVLWIVDLGEQEPAHFQPGDIVAQATEIGWSPEWGVGGMVGWFDASTIPTGSLTRWNNQTGGADFEAPLSAPTVVAGKIGARPAVVSDGVDDYMEMTLAAPYTGPVSVFAVAGTDTADNPAGTDFLWNAASAGSPGTDQRASLARDTDEAYVANRNVGSSFILTSASGAWTAGVHVIEARYDSADSYIHVDGVTVASGNMGASAPEIAKWGLLARNAESNFEAFYVGELIIVHGDVTSATRTRILNYLTDKWVP